MFTGIIRHTGIIQKIIRNRHDCTLEISSSLKLSKSEIGDSISCSGACLTLEKYNGILSKYYLSRETLNKTNFRFLKKGDVINLEKSLKFGDRVSGHFLQGHIDCTAIVEKIKFFGRSCFINFKLNSKHKKNLISKASIGINGVSLTISKILKNGFQIAIIPKTLKLSNLNSLKEKDTTNIEFDLLAKYIKNFLK